MCERELAGWCAEEELELGEGEGIEVKKKKKILDYLKSVVFLLLLLFFLFCFFVCVGCICTMLHIDHDVY